MGVLHCAGLGAAEDVGRHLAYHAGHQVAVTRESGEVEVTALLQIHLATFDHSQQVRRVDAVSGGVRHQSLHCGVA